MSDEYGIPHNMFGRVPERFYAILGRVVMVSAMLELRLLDLRTELEHVTQDAHAGESASQLIKGCRSRLKEFDPPFADTANAVLDRVRSTLDRRNDVVHSLWPHPDMDSAFGWRPVRPSKRDDRNDPYTATTLTGTELRELVRSSAALVGELDRLRERAALHR